MQGKRHVFRLITCVQKPKFGPFFANLFQSFSLALFFSFAFLSCLLAVLLPTLSSLFCMELWLANFLGKRQINLQRVVCKQETGSGFIPKMLPFLISVTLTGLVRISKMRYHWKDLSLKLLLFLNLYPASRGPSIFLHKSGSLKRSIVWQDKTGTILEPQMNRVLKHENRVSSFEKPAFFILTTQKDFRKQFISREM